MPEIEILLPGFSINTDQATLGLCTVTLVRGEKLNPGNWIFGTGTFMVNSHFPRLGQSGVGLFYNLHQA